MIHLGTKELKTERLLLRRVHEEDAKEIFEGFVNQEKFLYYANKKARTLEEEKESLRGINEKYKNEKYYNWVIVLNESNKIIGRISLIVDDYNESVEFNYAIDERFWNNGYMTEVLMAIKRFCFEEMKINRFQGCCCYGNNASKRVMEKCGMEEEGILKNYLKLEDGYHDMYMFSSINKERNEDETKRI